MPFALPKRRVIEKLTEDAQLFLEHGFVLDCMTEPTKSEAKKLWKLHKIAICGSFCKIYAGRMPYSWWRYDAPAEMANDDRERGFFAFRLSSSEQENECIERLGLVEQVTKLGYCEPQIEPQSLSISEMLQD